MAENGTVIGSGQYEHGREVTISATPNEGYEFVQWSDGDTCAIRKIVVIEDIELIAEFKAISIDTEVDEIQVEKMIVYTQNQTLYVEGIKDNYYVLDMIGNVIYYGQSPVVALPCGVYFVVLDKETCKIMVR